MNQLMVSSFSAAHPDKIELTGGARAQSITYELGLLVSQKETIVLNSEGSGIQWSLTSIEPSSSLTLELEELHLMNKGAFAYQVFVNGCLLATRTYEPLVCAPNNVFFEIPSEFTKAGEVDIEVQWLGEIPVGISRGWLYQDLDEYAEQEGLSEPLLVNEYVGDSCSRVEELPKLYQEHAMSQVGATFHIPFLGMSKKQIRDRIDRMILTAERCHIPAHWMLSNWWAGVAFSPDGQGGYFGDLRYSQLCVDQLTGREHPTIPNMWGDTLWPTMNDSNMNEVSCKKIAYAVDYLSKKMALSQFYSSSVSAFVLGWGTGYWFFTDRDGGDFHDSVREAARKDGITLTPDKGISSKQKDWLFKNNAQYHEEQVTACLDKMGVVTQCTAEGKQCYPKMPLSNCIYTHTIQAILYPSLDDRHPAWTSGMSPSMWASSEMYAFTDRRHYEYGFSNTLQNCVNLEVTMLSKEALAQYLVDSYAYGMSFVTLFNPDKQGENNALCELDKRVFNPAQQPILYRRSLLDLDVLRDYCVTEPQKLPVSIFNLKVSPDGKLYCDAKEQESFIEHTLSLDQEDSVWIEVEAVAESQDEIRVEFAAKHGEFQTAEYQSCCAPEDWFNKNKRYRWHFGNSEKKPVKVRISLDPSVTIKAIRITRDWKQPIQLQAPLTARQLRVRRTIVQHRLLSEKMLNEYKEKTDCQLERVRMAERALDKGEYRKMVSDLTKANSNCAPQQYAICHSGELTGTPFSATVCAGSSGVIVTVVEARADFVRLDLWTAEDTQVTFVSHNKNWIMQQDPVTNTVTFCPDANGDTKWELSVFAEKKVLPKKLDGLCYGFDEDVLRLESQDKEVGECAGYITVPLANHCVCHRKGSPSEPWQDAAPCTGDYVECELAADGFLTEIWAETRLIQDMLISYVPPRFHGVQHNGILEFQSGLRLELSYNINYTRLNLPNSSKLIKSYTVEQLQQIFCPGSIWSAQYAPIKHPSRNMRAQVLTLDSQESRSGRAH